MDLGVFVYAVTHLERLGDIFPMQVRFTPNPPKVPALGSYGPQPCTRPVFYRSFSVSCEGCGLLP